jgi:hypothetical protein
LDVGVERNEVDQPASKVDLLATTSIEEAALGSLLSGGRMNTYDAAVATAAARGDQVEALEIYAYNMALAAAYLGPLHILEVATRNSLHAQLSRHTKRSDWWDSKSINLVGRQQDAITDVEDKLDRTRRARANNVGRTPDDIVAALDFGFWCGLLGKGDARSGMPYEREIWQPAAQYAFPNYRGQRGQLWQLYDDIRAFRNRISHHEPVHHLDVKVQTSKIFKLIDFVSPPVGKWTSRRTRLPQIAASVPGSNLAGRMF